MNMKLKILLIMLIVVFVLTFFIRNYYEESRLATAKSSFAEMYNDRLLAERVIYKMTDLVHKKWLLNIRKESTVVWQTQEDAALSHELQQLSDKFGTTKLSVKEKIVFSRLKIKLEYLIINGSPHRIDNIILDKKTSMIYAEALSLLDELSEIQVAEGTKLNQEGQVALASSMVGLEFQSVLFIVLLLCLTALIKNTWVKSRVLQQHEWN
jgi:hypothetical protein